MDHQGRGSWHTENCGLGYRWGRDAATFKQLYNKVKHLENCTLYTDDWDAFAKVLPKDRHIIGKAHTTTIEQDNSNT